VLRMATRAIDPFPGAASVGLDMTRSLARWSRSSLGCRPLCPPTARSQARTRSKSADGTTSCCVAALGWW
jgi:hypothetical protein